MQGMAFPAVHSIISAAVPRTWQSSAVATVTAASYAGAALATAGAPVLIAKYEWPSVFYVFGAFALLWLPFWLVTTVPAGVSVKPPDAEEQVVAINDDGNAATEENVLLAGTEVETAEAQRQAADVQLADADDTTQLLGSTVSEASGALGLGTAFWALTKRREVWAICVAQYCQSWGMYTLLNWLPSFFTERVRPAHARACMPCNVQAPYPCTWAQC